MIFASIASDRLIIEAIAFGPPLVLGLTALLRWQRGHRLFGALTGIAGAVWLIFFLNLLSVRGV